MKFLQHSLRPQISPFKKRASERRERDVAEGGKNQYVTARQHRIGFFPVAESGSKLRSQNSKFNEGDVVCYPPFCFYENQVESASELVSMTCSCKLLQFSMVIVHSLQLLFREDCGCPREFLVLVFWVAVSFVVLFAPFYIAQYVGKAMPKGKVNDKKVS